MINAVTKVNKKTKSVDVQMHIKSSFDFINDHLPDVYAEKVLKKLKYMGITNISAGTIRNVKMRGAEKCNNIPVLTALLEVAKENKKVKEDLLSALSEIKSTKS
jgi:hypothetical protein